MEKPPKSSDKTKRARDIGIFTMIPSMLLVGPVLGWLLGRWAGNHWGHATTFEALGALLGFAAAIRQIVLLIQRHGNRS